MLRSVALWLVRVLGAQLVTAAIARQVVDAFFRMLHGVVDQTNSDIDNQVLNDLEKSVDKAALAELMARYLNGLLGS